MISLNSKSFSNSSNASSISEDFSAAFSIRSNNSFSSILASSPVNPLILILDLPDSSLLIMANIIDCLESDLVFGSSCSSCGLKIEFWLSV